MTKHAPSDGARHLAAARDSKVDALQRLKSVMATLRDPEVGCPWDQAQTSSSIASYAIEEAYELVDAIAAGNPGAICDELGDVLLQVVFHSQMAEEQGLFTFEDVALAIVDKMIRRHPHVFGDGHAPAPRDWEAIKAAERAGPDRDTVVSALDGVAGALPALNRAQKIQARAARVGFDWPDAQGPAAKIAEELSELTAATTTGERAEELGDLLFSVVNLARHHGIDAETALRDATRKFERRFRHVESVGGDLTALEEAELDRLWRLAKAEGDPPIGS